MKRIILATLLLIVFVSLDGSGHGEAAFPQVSVPLVTFVFDDGFDTDYLVAKDIFERQGAVACSAIVTDFINRKGFLTTDQVLGLRDAGWEILSHTASHPNLRSLPPAQIEKEFSRSKAAFEGLGLTVKNLVYPYNKSNETVQEIARKYYRSARGGKNELNHDLLDRYDLHSVSNKKLDLEIMEHDVDRAYAEKAWLIIHHHKIDVKVTLTNKSGKFKAGEQLLFSPSGAKGRHLRDEWFLTAGYVHFVLLAGTPQPGDKVIGQTSGTTALLNRVVYDQGAAISDLVKYVRTKYPDMKIVTIDAALDLLGAPDITKGPDAKNDTIGKTFAQKNMKKTSMLITGIGVISAAGNNVAETLRSFEQGGRHAGPVTLFPTVLKSPAFEVKRLPAEYYLEGWRTLSLALVAVDEAMKEARLSDLSGLRVGVSMGTTVASQLNALQFYKKYRESGAAPMTSVDRFLKGNLAEYIARRIGAHGPQISVVNACSSGYRCDRRCFVMAQGRLVRHRDRRRGR